MTLNRLAPVLLILAACGGAQAPAADPAASAAPASSAAPSAKPEGSASADATPPDGDKAAADKPPADEPASDAPKAKHVTVKLPAITWTKTPKLTDAPKGVAVSDASGMAVEMANAEINRVDGEWKIEVGESADLPFEERQSVTVFLKDAPKKGAKPTAAFGQNRGFFQIKKSDGKGTTSYNAPNAWAIEFTSWDAKPYDKAKGSIQDVGKAKGKLIVMYELGSDGYKNSWVAGTFEAPIRLWDEHDKPPPEKK